MPITLSRRKTVAWLGGGIVIIALICVGGAFTLSVSQDANATSVRILNDEAGAIRLSSCVDDALDLQPGTTGTVDVPHGGNAACSLYSDDQYRGCIIVSASRDRGKLVSVRLGLISDITEKMCQSGQP
jgi:hypothetical protein